tara:strand:+ start:58951 stop:59940 length:990 start_codon:yes stop_codon:yes gene_type:complete
LNGEIMNRNYGIICAILVGLFAYITNILLNDLEINIGASTLALILGAILANFTSNVEKGGKWLIKIIMPVAIILLGFSLNLKSFLKPEIGYLGLFVVMITAITSFMICYLIGRYMKLDLESTLALGTGGAICGNSAVIAVSPGLKLKEERVGVILAIINLLGLITFLIIPVLSKFLNLTEEQGGIWAGSVIHAVPQAIAAGEAIGPEAMVIATTIKLSRVSLLIIIVPLCAILGNNKKSEGQDFKIGKVPYFVPGFVLTAIIATWLVPEEISNTLALIGKFMLLPLLASVGFFINKESMKNAGGPVLIVGTIATICMLISSYLTIILFS